GADVIRWVYATANPAANINFGYGTANDVRRRFILPWWNVYAFFVTYAGLESLDFGALTASPPPLRLLDRWILSRLSRLVATIRDRLDDFDPAGASRPVEAFVDDLSTWYVRRSRRRFWKSGDDADKRAAYYTLYDVLRTLSRALAPFVPFLTEAIYQNLVRVLEPQAPESVHLCDYPEAVAGRADPELEVAMDTVRSLASLGRAARSAAKVRVRQPLPAVLVVTPDRRLRSEPELVDLLADELNVKEVRFIDDASQYVRYEVKPRFDRLGPKYGARVRAIAKAVRALPTDRVAAAMTGGPGIDIVADGESITIAPDELELRLHTASGYAAEGSGGKLAILETSVDEGLAREGRARELVHHIQQLRKEQGLDVSDRIVLYIDSPDGLDEVLDAHRGYVLAETLATEIRPGAAGLPGVREVSLDGVRAKVALVKTQ
ncbi:MAG TPA: DUF5915 domain-containing protein, partial [bacterium]|nr:DUF5915 domain-containing protein [bacterium]